MLAQMELVQWLECIKELSQKYNKLAPKLILSTVACIGPWEALVIKRCAADLKTFKTVDFLKARALNS